MTRRRLQLLWPLLLAGALGGPLLAPPAGAQSRGTAPSTSLVLPRPDGELQRALNRVLNEPPFRRLTRAGRISVALVDLTDSAALRYAALDDNHMRYAASLPKIAIMLGVFDQIDRGNLAYTPELREKLELMVRRSSNQESSELIELIGFDAIEAALRDPRYQLYDPARRGGLWVGKGYGGNVGYWQRDPMHNLSHGATARQVARFLVMMERGELVSPWASAEMKDIMGTPGINHKFVAGLDARPGSVIYRKSGSWRQWHADAAIVERAGRRYAAVALVESPTGGTVLEQLIVRLDDLIFRTVPRPRTVRRE